MFDIGASLKEAREKRGLSADDVQQALRIRERYLTALEEERWELLPGDAYTKGFLRTYAEFLGLNGTLYIDEYNERVASNEDAPLVPESLAPVERGKSRILFRTIAGVIAVAAVIAALMAFGSGGTTTANIPAAAAAATPPVVVRPGAIAHVRRYVPTKVPTALIRAVHGRSWFSVRVGGANGREIFRGFLNRGHKLTYKLDGNVWMRVGRPRVVTIAIGTSVVHGMPGTPVNLLLTRNGAKAG